MKYVMFRIKSTNGLNHEFPLIFPNVFVHSDVANAALTSIPELRNAEIVAAGECQISHCATGGNSVTLDLDGRDTDALHIRMMDYNHGITYE